MAQPVTTSVMAHPFARRIPDWCLQAVLIVSAALFSIGVSGYAGGQENNYYHLPILARLYDEPQFADDLFIQSLRFYASGFWMLFAGHAHGQDAYTLLFSCQIISRVILFTGLLAWARLVGIAGIRAQCVFVVLASLSSILRGYSKAGDGGLLIDYFTQSELANGTTLLALAWMARRRITAAFAMNGVTFFINAFIAVWTAVPMAFILWFQWYEEKWRLRPLLLHAVAGLAIFALLAVPVVHNIRINPYGTAVPPFDYVTFLEEFFPYHFLIWTIPSSDIWSFLVVFCCGLAATSALSATGSFLAVALWGAVMVWVAGIFLPFFTHSRLLLNLHLLRSGTTVHLLAAVAVAALATRWLFSRAASDRYIWAPALILSACTSDRMLPLIIIVLLLRRAIPEPEFRPWLRYGVATALLLPVILFSIIHGLHVLSAERQVIAQRDDWQALGLWARARTPETTVFLLPPGTSRGTRPGFTIDAGQDQLFSGAVVFNYFSHRQAWIIRASGSAVMWAPAYYPTWRDRLLEVARLKDLPARLHYAAQHDIAYVVDHCVQTDPFLPVARFGRLCVFESSRGMET
ncbi:hypothetical protein [Komagataeibacter kakiaceti]